MRGKRISYCKKLLVRIIFSDEVRVLELRRDEVQREHDKFVNRIKEFDSIIEDKQKKIEHCNNDIKQKQQEIKELHESMIDTDRKYKFSIKDNREALEKAIVELGAREDQYHNVLMNLDSLNHQRDELQNSIEVISRELYKKEETLNQLSRNIDSCKIEISKLNETILKLHHKEENLVSQYFLI